LDTTVRKVVIDNLPFLLSDTVGFIRKLPHDLVESFKSTLDEVRESDILVHVVDISHPDFEEQIRTVNETLTEIGAGDKTVIMVFNKVDAYTFVEKEEDDLTPATAENLSLEDLKSSWMASDNHPCIFISAKTKENFQPFKELIYGQVREVHAVRYPYNDFLY
jgi:GTP-binding protein HflX